MGQSITFNNGTALSNILNQIDDKCLVIGTSNPTGAIAVVAPGVFFYDEAHQTLYFCTSTDGTIGGTIWEPVPFVLPVASTTQAGIVMLAQESDALSGTDNTKALTSLAASIFAKSGNNSDITQLSGLEVPVPRAVGGTGLSSVGGPGFALVGGSSGNWISSNRFGLGSDGGNQTGSGTINLNFNSATRFTISGTWNIILPAWGGTDTDGFLYRIKMIGTSSLTFSVSDGSNVEGGLTYNVNTTNIIGSHYPCVDIQLIDETWWEV